MERVRLGNPPVTSSSNLLFRCLRRLESKHVHKQRLALYTGPHAHRACYPYVSHSDKAELRCASWLTKEKKKTSQAKTMVPMVTQ